MHAWSVTGAVLITNTITKMRVWFGYLDRRSIIFPRPRTSFVESSLEFSPCETRLKRLCGRLHQNRTGHEQFLMPVVETNVSLTDASFLWQVLQSH